MFRISVLVCLFMLFSYNVHADKVLIQKGLRSIPEEAVDAFVRYGYPDTNYGTNHHISFFNDGNDYTYTYIKFNLSVLPDDPVITHATLSLKGIVLAPAAEVCLYIVTEDWLEETITFNDQPSYTLDGKLTQLPDGYLGWNVFDVTDIVKSWIDGTYDNYGFRLTIMDGQYGNYGLYSSDYSYQSDRPKLEIDVIPEPASIILILCGVAGIICKRRVLQD